MNTRKKLLIAAISAGVLLAFVGGVSLLQSTTAQQTPEEQEIKWLTSLPEALTAAKETKTLILVDAYAEWCGWCKKLEKDTLSDAKVKAKMQEFTLLKIDTDKQPDVARKYGVTGLPTTLVLNAEGEVVLSRPGYMQPEAYLKLLTHAGEHAN